MYDIRLRRWLTALAVLVAAFVALLLVYAVSPAVRLEVDELRRLLGRADITPLREYLLAWGVWAPIVSAALQVVTSIFPPLPSWVLPIVNGMLFGAVLGGLLSWWSALLAAAVCFGIARVLGRPGVERLVPDHALGRWDGFFHRHGVPAVIVGRIVPFINPDILSYAAGLTRMGWLPFLVSIGVGSVPSILLYSWVGERGVEEVGWLLVPTVVTSAVAVVGFLIWRRWQRNAEG